MTKRQGQEDLSRRARPASARLGGEPWNPRLRSPSAKLGAKTQDARSRCPAPVGPVTPTQGRLEARGGADRSPGSSSAPREEELPVEPPGSERGWRVEPDPRAANRGALGEETRKGKKKVQRQVRRSRGKGWPGRIARPRVARPPAHGPQRCGETPIPRGRKVRFTWRVGGSDLRIPGFSQTSPRGLTPWLYRRVNGGTGSGLQPGSEFCSPDSSAPTVRAASSSPTGLGGCAGSPPRGSLASQPTLPGSTVRGLPLPGFPRAW